MLQCLLVDTAGLDKTQWTNHHQHEQMTLHPKLRHAVETSNTLDSGPLHSLATGLGLGFQMKMKRLIPFEKWGFGLGNSPVLFHLSPDRVHMLTLDALTTSVAN